MVKKLSQLCAVLIAVGLLATSASAAEPNPPQGEGNSVNKNGNKDPRSDKEPQPPSSDAAQPALPAEPAKQPETVKESPPAPAAPASQPDRPLDPQPKATDSPQPKPAAASLNRDDETDAKRPAADRSERRESRDERRDARDDRRDRVNAEGRREPSDAVRHQANRPLGDRADRRGEAARGGRARDYSAHFTNFGLTLNAATGGNGPLVISSIGPRGYFVDAGFREGDRIVSANGQKFNDQISFYRWLGTVTVGQRVAIVVVRNNRQETIYWTPSPDFVQAYASVNVPATQTSFLGIYLDEQIDDAAVVADVERDSPADQAGVQPEDVIVGINGERISNRADFDRTVSGIGGDTPLDMQVSRTLALRIGQSQPVVQTGGVVPATPAPPSVTPVPVDSQPVRVERAAPRGGLFRRGR